MKGKTDVNKIKSLLYRFFYGRYGVDKYEYFLLAVYAVLCIINAFLLIDLVQIMTWILFIYLFWRMMSRNYTKRRRENEIFIGIWSTIKINVKLFFDRIRYVRSARFRKCKHCKAIVKLPVKRGKHSVRCPKCSKSFGVRII